MVEPLLSDARARHAARTGRCHTPGASVQCHAASYGRCWRTNRPAGSRAGAGTPSAGRRSSARTWSGNSRDADRLLEVAGEPGVRGTSRRRARAATRVSATTGIRAVRASLASARAASAPSMSGSRRSIRITSGRCSAASAIPSAPVAASSVSETGGTQHVSGELQVPLVVVDDQDERLRVLEPGASPPYPLHVPIRLVLAEDHYLVREGLRRLLETRARVRGRGRVRRPRLAARRGRARSSRTSSSPTSACRRAATDEGIQAAERLRETQP